MKPIPVSSEAREAFGNPSGPGVKPERTWGMIAPQSAQPELVESPARQPYRRSEVAIVAG